MSPSILRQLCAITTVCSLLIFSWCVCQQLDATVNESMDMTQRRLLLLSDISRVHISDWTEQRCPFYWRRVVASFDRYWDVRSTASHLASKQNALSDKTHNQLEIK